MRPVGEACRCVLGARRHVQLRQGSLALPRGGLDGEFLDGKICCNKYQAAFQSVRDAQKLAMNRMNKINKRTKMCWETSSLSFGLDM